MTRNPSETVFQRARAGLEAYPTANPLVRGGLTLVAGVLTGNLLGFGRVAIIAYRLGTHSHADSLAVAMGPLDTLNNLLLNSVVFAFVPMLTACKGGERTALFHRLTRSVAWVMAGIAAVVILAAPWLMRVLAPGLDPAYFDKSVAILRILALSTFAAGVAAVHSALLYTDRRFTPTAFNQAAINIFVIGAALSLWNLVGVYSFAIGFTLGTWAQLAVVWFAARSGLAPVGEARCEIHWREILSKPAFFVIYAVGLALNITFTRAYATHAGPGMAAALDYCLRGVGVPLVLLVNPISNSLLPEIARLRSQLKLKQALRLIDKTVALAALAAVAGCAFALLFRKPAIRLLFEHGEFKAESTRLVSAAFLALGPSFVGWSLIEICGRSLFAIDRPWPPVIASMLPVLINVSLTLGLHSMRPDLIGLGASVGLMAGFLALFAMAHASRARWLQQG